MHELSEDEGRVDSLEFMTLHTCLEWDGVCMWVGGRTHILTLTHTTWSVKLTRTTNDFMHVGFTDLDAEHY